MILPEYKAPRSREITTEYMAHEYRQHLCIGVINHFFRVFRQVSGVFFWP